MLPTASSGFEQEHVPCSFCMYNAMRCNGETGGADMSSMIVAAALAALLALVLAGCAEDGDWRLVSSGC